MGKTYRIRPYNKSELAEAYAPCLASTSALNRLAHWINQNDRLSEALAQTGYRRNQRVFTPRHPRHPDRVKMVVSVLLPLRFFLSGCWKFLLPCIGIPYTCELSWCVPS